MGTILTIFGLIFFGFIIRALFKSESLSEKPKDTYSWFAQGFLSLLVGAFVWFMIIPTSCKKSSDNDRIDNMILKSSDR